MSLNFHSEAKSEFDEAYLWYEDQREGLGTEFARCVNEVLETIQRNPEIYAPVENRIRRALVRRFPFGVFYKEVSSGIRVIAIFHSKRNPEHWQTRK